MTAPTTPLNPPLSHKMLAWECFGHRVFRLRAHSAPTTSWIDEAPRASLLLASASPRRAELLRLAGYSFETSAADVDETPRRGESALAYGARVALDKAQAVIRGGRVCLAADTEVVLGRRIFGKPVSAANAEEMLEHLSGRLHRVICAVAIVADERVLQFQTITRVRFRLLGSAEISDYVASGEAFGKAGGYAVQGHAATFVATIDGSYTAVVGLPVYETGQGLAQVGVYPDWRQTIDSAPAASL